jgi:hypothetical protein
MNCSEWEREIAAESEDAAVQAHLRECADCRAFAREIEENRAALRSVPVNVAVLDAVRHRVLGELQSRNRRRPWMWPAAAAACVAIVGAWFALPLARNPVPPQPVEFAKAPKLVEWTVKPVRRTVRVPRNHAPDVASREPLKVKMLTNDPDVIVIWLIDQKGGSE